MDHSRRHENCETACMTDRLVLPSCPIGRGVEYFPMLIGRRNSDYIFARRGRSAKSIARRGAKTNGEYDNGYEYTLDHRGGDILVWRVRLVRARAVVLR